MSKSKFIISANSPSIAEQQELLGKFVEAAVFCKVNILSDIDKVLTRGWLCAEMDEKTRADMETKFSGKIAIEPDQDLQY